MAAAPNSIACFAALVAAFVLFFVFRHRRGIDTGEPAVQVDIGAALRAERPEHGVHGLAADGAEFAVFGVGHWR